MFNRKRRSNNTQSELLLINSSIRASSTVCIIQLLIAVTSCFVLAVNIQRYYNKPGTSTPSDWLQLLDGATLGKKTDNLKSSSFRWPARKFLSMISAITKWTSANYVSCLFTSLISQIFVIFISERKWLSKRSFICLSWIGLILFSRRQSEHPLIYNTLLSAVTCAISLYLSLMFTVGEKMFGHRRKKKRKKKEPKFEVEDDEELQPNNEELEQQSNCRKLKLPEDLDELEFAEKKSSLDENISSLSLGPCGLSNGRKHNNNGSWFKKELNDSFDHNNGRSESPCTVGNSLIWPAKFRVNGVSVHARNETANDLISENKKPENFGEFSDDEGSLFQTENFKRERNDLPTNRRRKIERMKSFCNLGNVQRVILVCSLTLNVIFLWMLKNYNRAAMFTQ